MNESSAPALQISLGEQRFRDFCDTLPPSNKDVLLEFFSSSGEQQRTRFCEHFEHNQSWRRIVQNAIHSASNDILTAPNELKSNKAFGLQYFFNKSPLEAQKRMIFNTILPSHLMNKEQQKSGDQDLLASYTTLAQEHTNNKAEIDVKFLHLILDPDLQHIHVFPLKADRSSDPSLPLLELPLNDQHSRPFIEKVLPGNHLDRLQTFHNLAQPLLGKIASIAYEKESSGTTPVYRPLAGLLLNQTFQHSHMEAVTKTLSDAKPETLDFLLRNSPGQHIPPNITPEQVKHHLEEIETIYKPTEKYHRFYDNLSEQDKKSLDTMIDACAKQESGMGYFYQHFESGSTWQNSILSHVKEYAHHLSDISPSDSTKMQHIVTGFYNNFCAKTSKERQKQTLLSQSYVTHSIGLEQRSDLETAVVEQYQAVLLQATGQLPPEKPLKVHYATSNSLTSPLRTIQVGPEDSSSPPRTLSISPRSTVEQFARQHLGAHPYEYSQPCRPAWDRLLTNLARVAYDNEHGLESNAALLFNSLIHHKDAQTFAPILASTQQETLKRVVQNREHPYITPATTPETLKSGIQLASFPTPLHLLAHASPFQVEAFDEKNDSCCLRVTEGEFSSMSLRISPSFLIAHAPTPANPNHRFTNARATLIQAWKEKVPLSFSLENPSKGELLPTLRMNVLKIHSRTSSQKSITISPEAEQRYTDIYSGDYALQIMNSDSKNVQVQAIQDRSTPRTIERNGKSSADLRLLVGSEQMKLLGWDLQSLDAKSKDIVLFHPPKAPRLRDGSWDVNSLAPSMSRNLYSSFLEHLNIHNTLQGVLPKSHPPVMTDNAMRTTLPQSIQQYRQRIDQLQAANEQVLQNITNAAPTIVDEMLAWETDNLNPSDGIPFSERSEHAMQIYHARAKFSNRITERLKPLRDFPTTLHAIEEAAADARSKAENDPKHRDKAEHIRRTSLTLRYLRPEHRNQVASVPDPRQQASAAQKAKDGQPRSTKPSGQSRS